MSLKAAKKKLETDVAERDKQLKTLKESAGDNEALKTEITKLQNESDVIENIL